MHATSEFRKATPGMSSASPATVPLPGGLQAGQPHPAEIILASLLRGHAVKLIGRGQYRLGDDLELGLAVGPDGDSGFVLPRDVEFGVFLAHCNALDNDELTSAAACNSGGRQADEAPEPTGKEVFGTTGAPAQGVLLNPAEPGSAVAMFALHPRRPHPGEIVLGALLRGGTVDLPDGRCYRLGDDLTLGTVGIGPDDGSGYVIQRSMGTGAFLRLCSELSFNEVYDLSRGRRCALAAAARRRTAAS